MGRFLVGIVIGIVLVVGAVFVYFTTGMAPAAATASPMPFERYFAGRALRATIQRDAPKTVPVQATPENLLEGAKVYKQNCAFCHGLPNSPGSGEGRAMFPDAPQFFARRPNFGRGGRRGENGGEGRGRGEPGERGQAAAGQRGQAAGQRGARGGRGRGFNRDAEIAGDFWRVKYGIRLTGMPSYEKILSEQQMWDVTLMVDNRRNLPPAVSAVLAPTPAPADQPASQSEAPAASPEPN